MVDTVTSGDAVTMREASSLSPRASSLSTKPKPCWVDICAAGLKASCCGTSIGRGETAAAFLIERRCGQECFRAWRRLRQTFELVPFMAGANVLRGAPLLHLRHRHQAGVVVLVALHRQADALDGVGDEADRAIVIDRLEGLDHAGHVVSAEVGHQRQQFVVAAAVDQLRHLPLIADVVLQMLAEGGAALEAQRRVHLVRAIIDPAP